MQLSNEFYHRGDCLNRKLGAILLESKKAFDVGFYIVMALIPKRHEYVTWLSDGKNFYHGRYTLDIEKALKDFEARN